MKNKLSIFIIILFIYSLSYAKELNMVVEEVVTTVPSAKTMQELLAAKTFLKNYEEIDSRLNELNGRVNFSSVFDKKNKIIKYLSIGYTRKLNFKIKDDNNENYSIFRIKINEYRNEARDTLTKKVYQITIAPKGTPTKIIDGQSYVTSGMSITIVSFYGDEGYVMAQHQFLNSLLNSTTPTIPYIKENVALGELALKNSFFSIERDWHMIWIDNNIFVKISSRDIPENKIIEIAQWINAYIQ